MAATYIFMLCLLTFNLDINLFQSCVRLRAINKKGGGWGAKKRERGEKQGLVLKSSSIRVKRQLASECGNWLTSFFLVSPCLCYASANAPLMAACDVIRTLLARRLFHIPFFTQHLTSATGSDLYLQAQKLRLASDWWNMVSHSGFADYMGTKVICYVSNFH